MKIGLYLACYPELIDDWNYTLPPLGLGYLASYVKKYVGGVDFIIARDVDELIEARPDLVGVSFVTYNASIAARHAKKIKEALGVPVLCGGPHASPLPVLDPAFDVAVLGEGEETFAELVRLFNAEGQFDPRSLAGVQGIIYRDETGAAITTARRPFIKDLDTVPYPDRTLMYERWNRPGREAQIMTSRGCPYDCSFCSTVAFWGTAYRCPSIEYVVSEIEQLRREYDPKTIHIYDDLFTVKKDRVVKMLATIRERGLNEGVRFTCFVRSNLLDDEIMEAFAKTGFDYLNIGFESASDEMLKVYNKKSANAGRNQQVIDIGRKHGVRYSSCFIMGGPGERREDIVSTFDFISANISQLRYVEFSPLQIFPGTDMWRRVKEMGLRDENNMAGIVIEPEDLVSERDFYINRWPYLNEANISREEFYTYLQMGNALARTVWSFHDLRERGEKREIELSTPESIAENVALTEIIQAKTRRRLRKIMPMGEWMHPWDAEGQTAKHKIEKTNPKS
ncbi:B12-binding domain-containing radical SAM protein [bacterium]|nr:B12-binding domain-containing radical SAM protein [bacterium]